MTTQENRADARYRRGVLIFACFGLIIGVATCASTVNEKDRVRAKTHYDIAVAQMNQGEMRNALRELLSAVQLDSELAVAQNALGLVYHSMDRQTEALEHYQKAVEINVKFSEAYNNMGILLIDMGRYDEAITSFKIALGDILYATPSLAEGNMGWAYYRKGEAQSGKRHLRNAVATNPKFCRGYQWLARIGLDEKKPRDTVDNYERFRRHCLEDQGIAETLPAGHQQEMKYYLALAYLQQGQRTDAKTALSECAQATDTGFGIKCAESLQGLR